jgi:hypothetical protein
MTGVRLTRDISRVVPRQHGFAVDALQPVSGRRGLIAKAEVLEEIKRLRARTPEAK